MQPAHSEHISWRMKSHQLHVSEPCEPFEHYKLQQWPASLFSLKNELRLSLALLLLNWDVPCLLTIRQPCLINLHIEIQVSLLSSIQFFIKKLDVHASVSRKKERCRCFQSWSETWRHPPAPGHKTIFDNIKRKYKPPVILDRWNSKLWWLCSRARRP